MTKVNTKSKRKFKSPKRSAITSVAALATCIAAPVSAQSTADEAEASEGNNDNIIIVTASRREEQSVETPVSLTAVDPSDLLDKGITDINGLADFVPNLQAADGGAPGLGNLVIRGLYAGGAPTTGIYINDVPYGPVIGGAGNSLAFDGSLFDLDRVEVLRGPQGTLFGSTSLGGTVRYVTAQPSLTDFEGMGEFDLSTTRNGGTNYRLRGRLSAPIAQDVLAVSVAGYYEDTGGYIDQPVRNLTNVDGSEFWGLQGSVLFTPVDDLEIRLNAIHQESDFDNNAFVDFDPATGTPFLGNLTNTGAVDTPLSINTDLYSGTIEYDFGFATLTSVTSFQNIQLTANSDLTAAFGPLADFLAPGGAPHTVGFTNVTDTDRFTQEVRLTSDDNKNLEWLVGIYYTDQDTSARQVATPNPDDILLLDGTNFSEYQEIAGFANLTYYINENWDITGGIRVSDYKNTANTALMGSPFVIGPGPFPSGSRQEDTFVSYLINTRYRVSDGFNLYARAANGFRPGGANLVVQVGGMTLGDPAYNADSLWSYEFGAKGVIFGGDAIYDVGFYYVDWNDTQLTNVLSAIGGITNAVDGAKAWGIEAAISGEPIENFQLTATLGISNNELKADNPILGALEGEELAGDPDFSASVIADYIIPVSDTVDINLGATLRITGDTSISYRGGTGVGGVPIAPANPFFENDSYAQLDLRAGVKFDAVTLQFYVTNVTDSDAYQSIFTTAPNLYQAAVLRPRTIGAFVRFDF